MEEARGGDTRFQDELVPVNFCEILQMFIFSISKIKKNEHYKVKRNFFWDPLCVRPDK